MADGLPSQCAIMIVHVSDNITPSVAASLQHDYVIFRTQTRATGAGADGQSARLGL